MNLKNTKFLSLIISLLLIFNSKAISSIITYKEILDNPTDLELNLNYAKQQEKSGNIKSTIATLERLSMLYPKNADIKIYLLSILLKMDSKVKVDLMVRTILNDPNTTDETRNLIAELLTDKKFEEEEPKKWFSYIDFTYSGTEEDNISGRTKSGKVLAVDTSDNETLLPFAANDSGHHKSTMEYDKTYTRGTSLTIGRILDQTSSLYLNLGSNFNTNNKKHKGESDIYSSSISYFKAYKNHYFSPYVYFNQPNYRRQEDYQVKGLGINNTYIFNDKFNLNYTLSYSDSRYHSRPNPIVGGIQLFKDAGDNNNNEAYSASIRLNHNISNRTQISTKLIYGKTDHAKEFHSYESNGINFQASKIFSFGTLTASATYLYNAYQSKNEAISMLRYRNDRSLVTNISLRGDINQILPFLRMINKDNTTFYTLSFRESNVNSSLPNYEIKRAFKTIGITKRVNFNE